MLCYVDLDLQPDAEFFEDLDDWEVGQVLKEAIEAEVAAEEWWVAANDELSRRRQQAIPLHQRLRVAEERRLERRRRTRGEKRRR
jgi:hypothetical protein